MIFKDLLVGENDNSRRFDKVLSRILPEKHDPIPKLIRKNLIKLNGKKADISVRVKKGDTISIAKLLLSSLPDENEISQTNIDYETIFENKYIKIINKPYGINVQPSKNSNIDLSTQIQREYKLKNDYSSLSFVPGALHRLDRNTTGLLAFGQSLIGAQWFSENLHNHNIKKTYIGLAHGHLQNPVIWNDYLQDKHSQNNFFTVEVTNSGGQKAVTKAIPLCYGIYQGKDVTLIQYDIETGRKHQIRCQTSFHGHYLLGDTAYGADPLDNEKAFYLHAIRLKIPQGNPLGLPEELIATVPKDFSKMLSRALIKWNGELII